ncbi:MarR family winged helix-turn-helix transcriptional regulator [Nocardioides sp. AX2bis]|uniref:MarR family winged helix-turn-helix transcriptional regulator n=1 Tax=Nocardioides sp. AX2bis TaxID=2653157 RepID=UPI0012EFEC27|nr:MarR family transcriptional regulator [Nocardioides sp. AX2bis]VXC38247.1 DNA-binding transcriptional regulator, MarR family [Nocardioides sp. AX2bis]
MLEVLAALPGHLLFRARMRVAAELAAVLPADVDVHGFAVLHVLGDGRARSQQDLAEAVAVSGTTLGTVAAALVRQRLVARVRNPADRRSWLLTRTPAADDALRAWGAHVDEVVRRLTAPLGTSGAAELRDLLHAVADPHLPAPVPPVLRASTGFLVTRVHERAHRDFLEALAPVGLEPRHFAALVVLAETGPVPQADLARHLGLSGARVVQIVDGLEERGLVSRRAAAGDRRTHLLHREAGADAATDAARAVGARAIEDLLSPLSAEERSRLSALLRAFVS